MDNLLQDINVWTTLAQLGVAFLLLGIAVAALWNKNNKLIDSIKERDEANLATLLNIGNSLDKLQGDGRDQTKELKDHVDDRITTLKELLKK